MRLLSRCCHPDHCRDRWSENTVLGIWIPSVGADLTQVHEVPMDGDVVLWLSSDLF